MNGEEAMMRALKMGGRTTLRVLLAGGQDVSQALLAPDTDAPRLRANLQALLDAKAGGCAFELGRTPACRSDVLLQNLEATPQPEDVVRLGLSARGLGPWEGVWDVVVFAMEPELAAAPWRHRASGYLAYALQGVQPPPDRFEPAGALAPERSKENLARLIAAVKDRLDAHVVVFNASSLDPEAHVSNYHGRDDDVALCIHKLNLGLIELSMQEGISIIDVDRLIAEMGGKRHVRAACRYSEEAYEAIGVEFMRVLEDIGFFENRPLIMQIGRKG